MKELIVPSLRQILDNSARNYGEDVFIEYIEDGKKIQKSYIEVRTDALAACRYLRSFSTEKRHIAILGKTGYEYIIFFLAIILSGNAAVPLAPEISASEAAKLVETADVDAFIYGDVFLKKAGELDKLCPKLFPLLNYDEPGLFNILKRKYSDDSEFSYLSEFEVDLNDCCAIIYTSGTTGSKKGVMLSSASLIGNILYTDNWDILTRGRSTLSILPMHHLYCFSGDVIRNLKDGVKLCLNGDMRYLQKNLLLFNPYVMRAVPLIAQSLLQRFKTLSNKNPDKSVDEIREMVYGKNLRQIISGAAYLSPELVREYEIIGIKILQGYGMTEAGCRISVPDENAPVGSVGRVIDICDVRIVNGEIQVHTPSLMLGYYNMPEQTSKVITKDGWLRTGDIGNITEDGYLFIKGRLKNLIILSGGENVSPEAIEKKFNDFEPIEEMVVAGENDRLVAHIYPNYEYCRISGITDIENTIRTKINEINTKSKPSHIISDVIIHTDPLPKTETGKLKRNRTIIG